MRDFTELRYEDRIQRYEDRLEDIEPLLDHFLEPLYNGFRSENGIEESFSELKRFKKLHYLRKALNNKYEEEFYGSEQELEEQLRGMSGSIREGELPFVEVLDGSGMSEDFDSMEYLREQHELLVYEEEACDGLTTVSTSESLSELDIFYGVITLFNFSPSHYSHHYGLVYMDPDGSEEVREDFERDFRDW